MIEVFKLGAHLYEGKVDKNSGLYEVNLIKQECDKLHADATIIINGLANNEEKAFVLNCTIRPKIFIASDICFKDNVDIINDCDVLLHQAQNTLRFREFCTSIGVKENIRMEYGYVPELFYVPIVTSTNKLNDSIIFGGGHISEYKLKEYDSYYPMKLFIRNDAGIDKRLPYNEYRQELEKHMFALIIAREDYIEFGWITARYFETVASKVIPILDEFYDICHYLDADYLKIYEGPQLACICNEFRMDDTLRVAVLNNLSNKCAMNRGNFLELLSEVIYDYASCNRRN